MLLPLPDSFVYDASHRLQRHYANASRNGNNIGEYHYDKIGRLTRVNNPSSVGSARIYVELGYYVTGRLHRADIYDSAGNKYLKSYVYDYDSLGNMVRQMDSSADGKG